MICVAVEGLSKDDLRALSPLRGCVNASAVAIHDETHVPGGVQYVRLCASHRDGSFHGHLEFTVVDPDNELPAADFALMPGIGEHDGDDNPAVDNNEPVDADNV